MTNKTKVFLTLLANLLETYEATIEAIEGGTHECYAKGVRISVAVRGGHLDDIEFNYGTTNVNAEDIRRKVHTEHPDPDLSDPRVRIALFGG